MTSLINQLKLRIFAPGRCQFCGGKGRANHIVTALNNMCRQMFYAVNIRQNMRIWHEAVMAKIMRFNPRHAECGGATHMTAAGAQCRTRCFIGCPPICGGLINGRVAAVETLVIGIQQIGPLVFRDMRHKLRIGLWEKPAHFMQKPRHLITRSQKYAAQNQTIDMFRIGNRIGQRQCAAP